jgi:signal transduction histidine kinase
MSSSTRYPPRHPVLARGRWGTLLRAPRSAWRRRGERQADLRLLIAAIPVLAVLPLLLFSVSLLTLLDDARSAEVRRDLQRTAQTLSVALEREIGASIRRLETIADLPAARADDLAALQQIASRELARNDDWRNLLLFTPEGQVLFSARPAQAPTLVPMRPHITAVIDTQRPAVSDLFVSGLDGSPTVAVTVPVLQGGRVRWLMAARLNADALSRRLAEQIGSQGAIAELFDRDGRLVARSSDLPRWSAYRAPDAYTALVAGAGSGIAAPFPRGDGELALGAWARLPFGWSVALSLETEAVRQERRPLWMLGLLGLVLLAGTLGLAVAIARRITGIVAEAGRAAQAVARARHPRLGTPPIRQFSVLFDAMNEAGERVVDALERERRARTAAETADRQKDRFLLMLGHELRNPLNAVANAGHLLRRRDLTPGQRDGVLEMLQRQSRQLRRLVDDLLDLGRVLTGKLGLRRESVDVDTVVRQSIATLSATGQLGGHTVRAELDPVRCELDPARFEQVFANLFINAVKYTPSGGTITVGLSQHGRWLQLSVRDTGIGIDPAEQQRIFSLFVQGPQAEERAAGGLGVGLSLVRMLVELHGGTIVVHSAGRGHGSEFVVRLPGVRCVDDGTPQPPTDRRRGRLAR